MIPHLLEKDYTGFKKSLIKEKDEKIPFDNRALIIIFFAIFYQLILIILLNIFTNDVKYYGENCKNLLGFADTIFAFQYVNEFFESLYILGTIGKMKLRTYSLLFWGIFSYFSIFILGILYLVYLSEGESCGNLGDLFLANLIIFYICLPLGLLIIDQSIGLRKFTIFILKQLLK